MFLSFLRSGPRADIASDDQTQGTDQTGSAYNLPGGTGKSHSRLLHNPAFWALLSCALVLRVYLAMTTTYIWDEDRDWISGALSISFLPESLSLPLRMKFHGVLPAYFIKISSIFFGESIFGFRIIGIFFGLATIIIVALLTNLWAGKTAALWATAFLAFNEYHVMFSTVAIQKTYFLFFSALAVFTFFLALERNKPDWLYATAVCTGLAFLCYEIAALLVPVFGITALFSRHRVWLIRPHPYIAGIVLLLVISPDLLANFLNDGGSNAEFSYDDHLKRFGGIGFIKHYYLFYFMEIASYVYKFFGVHLHGADTEYAPMNSVFGVLLFSALVFWTLVILSNKSMRRDSTFLFLLILFWFTLLFFSIIKPGAPRGPVASHLWIWVDVTLIPAVILAGVLVSRLSLRLSQVAAVLACAGMAYATFNVLYERLDLPSHSLAFSPKTIVPSEGEMHDVRAHIKFCDLCDEDADFRLLDIAILEKDGNSLTSAFESGDVEGAESGTKDTDFRLRAAIDPGGQSWVDRLYVISYEIQAFSGGPLVLREAVLVVRDSSQHRDPLFWAHD